METDNLRLLHSVLSLTVLAIMLFSNIPSAQAEYGDVVINNYADAAGMRPVIFPHWFHRMRFTCKVCHADLGFKLKAGGNQITMSQILEGKFCGACHNGEIAWNVENCNTCHSGKPGTPTQVHENTVQKFIAPPLVVPVDMSTYEHKGTFHKLLRPLPPSP